jgi:ribosomal protein S6--L-glutamate ligase
MGPWVRVRGRDRGLPDAVIPRVGSLSPTADLHVVRQLELAGCAVLNRADATGVSRDKVACAQVLVSRGVEVPRGALLPAMGSVQGVVRRVGGLPVVVKRARGAGGVGVMLARTLEEVVGHARLLWEVGAQVLVQEFVAEARGTDVRVLVVGGKAVASMERRARAGEFRANVHLGGVVRPVDLDAGTRRLAERATRALGLGLAGVDLVMARRGPLVVEVNASPGLWGIERASGRDLAAVVVRHALRLAGAGQRAA